MSLPHHHPTVERWLRCETSTVEDHADAAVGLWASMRKWWEMAESDQRRADLYCIPGERAHRVYMESHEWCKRKAAKACRAALWHRRQHAALLAALKAAHRQSGARGR